MPLSPLTRRRLLATTTATFAVAAAMAPLKALAQGAAPTKDQVLATMKRATTFMADEGRRTAAATSGRTCPTSRAGGARWRPRRP